MTLIYVFCRTEGLYAMQEGLEAFDEPVEVAAELANFQDIHH